jgi:hypothetical protein
VIQVYRPTREIEQILGRDGSRVKVTDVQLVDGNVETYIEYAGQPRMFSEEPWQVFQGLRVTGAKLADVEFASGNVYYTLAEVEQAYIPFFLLEQDWLSRDGRLRTLTGVHLAGDGVDYEVQDAGRPDVKHETEESVLRTLRIRDARLTGVDLKDGSVYYTVAKAS